MASNLPLIVLLVLVSLSVTSAYSLSTRDAVLKQDDESYFMATSDQGSSMIDVEDLAKARSLQALVAGSKVVVNKASSKRTSTKSSKKKKHKSKKVGSLDVSALVGIIIAAIVVTIVILCVIYFFYLRHKAKKAQSIEQEKVNGSSETQTSKIEDRV